VIKDLELHIESRIYISLDPNGIHIMPVYSDPQVKMAQKQLREKKVQIGAAILVAGQGTRLGEIPKSLMKIEGKTLLERHVGTLMSFVTQPVIVVTGFYAKDIQQELEHHQVQWVHNPQPELGQSSSVRLALEELYKNHQSLDVIMMMLGDQPYLNASDLRQLIEHFKVMVTGQFLIPMVDGIRGNPVLLSGLALKKIIESSPDMTVRKYMDLHPELVSIWESSNHHFIFDLDTPQDIDDFESKTGLTIELPSR
jgi:molybdenum cofactor cytidylyltransferase/nicotine blue oxidoreductase